MRLYLLNQQIVPATSGTGYKPGPVSINGD